MLHGHATPAAQGHFSPVIVPFSIQKLDGEMRTPSGTASDGGGTFSSPALPPQTSQPQSGHSPNPGSWEKNVEAKNSAWSGLITVLPIFPSCRFSQSTATPLLYRVGIPPEYSCFPHIGQFRQLFLYYFSPESYTVWCLCLV